MSSASGTTKDRVEVKIHQEYFVRFLPVSVTLK
jgi:hypothetical protein